MDEGTGLSELNELGLHLPDPNPEKANAQGGKSLEVLLATKNKRILEELTRFRVGVVVHDQRSFANLLCRYCTAS